MDGLDIATMSFDDLLALRENIDRILLERAAAERRQLETKLAKLQTIVSEYERARSPNVAHPLKGVKLSPKYLGPQGETWAGRGARPKWLTTLLRRGHKLDEFAIDKAAAVATQKSSSRKANRPGNVDGREERRP